MRTRLGNDARIPNPADETASPIDALCERDELIREMMECLQGKDTARIPQLIAEAERLIPQKSLWEDDEML